MQQAAFGVARARWGLTIERPNARCGALLRQGGTLLSNNRVVARLPATIDPAAADFLVRVLNAHDESTLQALEAANAPIPLRPQDAAEAERAALGAEQAALLREQAILGYRAEIDALVAPLFVALPHPPIIDVRRLG